MKKRRHGGGQQRDCAGMPAGTVAGGCELNHLPAYILPGPMAVAVALRDRFPSLLNSLWITTEEAAGGLAGQHRCGRGGGHGLCAVALAAATRLSLHDSAADGADRGDCAADHQLDWRREFWRSRS